MNSPSTARRRNGFKNVIKPAATGTNAEVPSNNNAPHFRQKARRDPTLDLSGWTLFTF
jgi:hypothetical protein